MAAQTDVSSKDASGGAAYKEMIGNLFNYGSVALAYGAATEAGIVTTLCEAKEPLTSTQVATLKNLKERLVREILNALAAARVVQLEEGTGGQDGTEARYFVSEADKQAFNVGGVYCTAITSCARNISQLVKNLQMEGPSCGEQHAQDGESNTFDVMDAFGVIEVDNTFAALLKTPGLRNLLDKGIDVCEIGGGTGRLMCILASMFPNSRFTLTDIDNESVQRARQRAQEQGLTTVTCHVLDVCKAVPDDWAERFHWVLCCNVIHDVPHPLKALQGIYKTLKPGGKFSLNNMFTSNYVANNAGNLKASAYYALGTFISVPESNQQADSEALGSSWGEEKARELCGEAGFKVVAMTRSGGTEDMGVSGVLMCEKP